jgi:nitrite reductase/ring-hydroxylating ferredoxin subunit/uncharacterized membrane protein
LRRRDRIPLAHLEVLEVTVARNPIVDLIDRQEWLGSIAGVLAPAVTKAFKAAGKSGRDVKNFLNGVWLAHPLHPVLTDIPIGAWTTALVFDAASAIRRNDSFDRGADAAIGIGLVGAAGAAVTGLTDWSDTDGTAKKMGLVHGVMNLTATGLYIASLVSRNRRQRKLGRLYALLGFATSCSAAYLGGELVYSEQVGVNHALGQDAPPHFTPVLNERELKEGKPTRAQVGDVAVVLVRQGNRVFALANTCAHLGGPLAEGSVEDGAIECPWHASKYALEDGRVLGGPSTHPQPAYECRIRGGQVEIRARREQPAEPQVVPQRRAAS